MGEDDEEYCPERRVSQGLSDQLMYGLFMSLCAFNIDRLNFGKHLYDTLICLTL